MFVSPIFSSPIQQRIDVPGQPAFDPVRLSLATYLAARTVTFGPEFLVSSEGQAVHKLPFFPLRDSQLVNALQVLRQPGHEEGVQLIFEMITTRPMPRDFESDLHKLMNQTQGAHSMPDVSNATIDLGALLDFARQNPGQALSRPEILSLVITWLDFEATGTEHWVNYRDELSPLPKLAAADVDEVLAQSSMSPLWDGIEEMFVEVPELHVDEELEGILGADVFETMLALPGAALPEGGGAEVLRSLDVQPELPLPESFPLLAAQLSNVQGS